MRIAFFTDTFFPQVNGVSRTMDRQIKFLTDKGHEVLIFAPEYEEGKPAEEYGKVVTAKSIKVFFYPEARLSITLPHKIKKILTDFHTDLIHIVTEFTMGLAGHNAGNYLNIPMVSTYHTDYDKYMDYYKMGGFKPIAWKYLKKIHNDCRITFCPSHDTKRMLNSKGISRVKVLSNGVETDLFNPQRASSELRESLGNSDKLMILYVGRIAMEKDIDVLIKAYDKVRHTYKDKISLVITGDGTMKERYQKQFGNDIIFTGYKKGEDLAQVYASADIFAYPSTTETFGNVIIEAMASGLPVVAAATGGILDSVIDGYNGLLTTPKDVDSFADGIVKFIENDAFRKDCANHAAEYAKTKSWDLILDDMYNTFVDVLAGKI